MVKNVNIQSLFKEMEQPKYIEELTTLLNLLSCCTPEQILSEGIIPKTKTLINRVNESLPSISTLITSEISIAINTFIEKNRLKC